MPGGKGRTKGVIFYYSGSGNTRLACHYITKRLPGVEFELVSIINASPVGDLGKYDVVGLATFADFFGPPKLFCDFVQQLPVQENKMTFLLVTYGSRPGTTIKTLGSLVEARGFEVVAEHYLKTPESFPPAVVYKFTDENAPHEKDMKRFDRFIQDLGELVKLSPADRESRKIKVKLGLINNFYRSLPRTTARRMMGRKAVDEVLCSKCGTCARGCPYNAVTLIPFPSFDMTRCYGCWYCYNHCPKKAIYTRGTLGFLTFKNIGHYPKPNEQLEKKLGI
jgi:NAD-dependent dihydropyrimidine dehydrogenase PreA subunit